jgi:hypothetical protein
MMKRIVLLVFIATALASGPGVASAARPPVVRISAEVTCLTDGGIGIDLSVENRGTRVAYIDPDLHVLIEAVRMGGRQDGVVLFVFPAPGFDRIPSGETRTFLLTAGEPFEGEPAIDFSGSRILIEVEIWLRHRIHPATRTLSFPACG